MTTSDFLMGFDIGSSSVKATLLEAATGKAVASATSPDTELEILAEQPGWAEQHPDTWWGHVCRCAALIGADHADELSRVGAIGISYQMHGLVVVDRSYQPLRNAIIWCDSRAVETGAAAFEAIGPEQCLSRLLNSPGNFTASKLKWVKDNEPDTYAKIHRMMLPGDYVAMRLTGDLCTTPSGLSEGILWDFQDNGIADMVLDHFGIPRDLLPPVKGTFAVQGGLSVDAAERLGMPAGTPVSYRGGDQPNNALSLNVLQPGDIAATAGTSGVVYGVADTPVYDPESRVNTFVHVNHSAAAPRYGMLLCVNGTGILNSWLKHNTGHLSYGAMDDLASEVTPGSNGLVVLPYGNGAERTLGNRNPGAMVHGLQLTSHTQAHLYRAAQEGIVFALKYGLEIMQRTGVPLRTIRAGHANMFLSPLFREAFATTTGAAVELYDTDGSQGAARGAGIGAGIYPDPSAAFVGLEAVETIEPSGQTKDSYDEAYQHWCRVLTHQLSQETP
jgi:xylulokinase